MELYSKPFKNPAVIARKILGDEMVLVNADNAASVALTNRTAILIWELVDGSNSVQKITDDIKSQFKDVPDQVTEDVQNLLKLLSRDGFIGVEYTNSQ